MQQKNITNEWRHQSKMSYEILKEDIKNRKIKNCYILSGEEEYLKKTALSQIYNVFCNNTPKELSYFEFDSKGSYGNTDELDWDEVIDCMDSISMFGNNKLIVINNAKIFSSEDANNKKAVNFIEYINRIPEYICLVFYNKSDLKLLKSSKLYKAVKKNYGEDVYINFKPMDLNSLAKWVISYAKKKKRLISLQDSQYLVEIKDYKMNDILIELDKLINYVEESQEIKKQHVDELCSKSIEYQIFALTDQISQKNINLCFKILNSMKEKKTQPTYIISMLNWQFKNILQVMELESKGCSKSMIANDLKIKDFQVSKYQNQAKNFTQKQVAEAICNCQEADYKMKTGGMEPFLLIESIIVKFTKNF